MIIKSWSERYRQEGEDGKKMRAFNVGQLSSTRLTGQPSACRWLKRLLLLEEITSEIVATSGLNCRHFCAVTSRQK